MNSAAFWAQVLCPRSVAFSILIAGLSAKAAAPDSAQSSWQIERVQPIPALRQGLGEFVEPVLVTLRHLGSAQTVSVRMEQTTPVLLLVTNGSQTMEVLTPAVPEKTERFVRVELNGQVVARQAVTLKPVRKLTIYVLPHSHNDIGYTEIQTAVEKKQVNNLITGMQWARKTANYPEGARFVWNMEVLWAADLSWHRMDATQRSEFIDAVKNGQVALNGMYLNELTGLCRPEELIQLFRYGTKLADQCGVPVESAMISDVPGYTWGSVTAMAQAGIKYFSPAPNFFDRIGDILEAWQDKPFYWVSASGKERVLVWIPFMGYALSHVYGKISAGMLADMEEDLDRVNYPYEIAYTRWSGHGDNAVPDPAICDAVRDWNAEYAWPKFRISSTTDAFRALEERYASKIPVVRGDWTPYWEDGAGSSARETAMNRNSSDRLTQAQALWAMLNPAGYPVEKFDQAWRNVLLYSEHTWGADCSVWDPESQKTREQWEIKRGDAVNADARSRALIDNAFAAANVETATNAQIDVFNTTSWPRTELVVVPKELSAAGDQVTDNHSRPVDSQRLTTGELAFIARDVAPFASRRYSIGAGSAGFGNRRVSRCNVTIAGAELDNGLLHLRVDEKTGGIIELRAKGIDRNLADTASGNALNDYVFLPGNNLADVAGNGPVSITIKEPGPLVASLQIDSDAPGCKHLTREVRLVAGGDYVELINTVDKNRAAIPQHPGDHPFSQSGGKESVNFAFPLNVPDGEMKLDIPFACIRPEADQIPGSCKNWFPVGRWVDVSNERDGITWVTLDAPLIEVGEISARMLGSQHDPKAWRKHVSRSQRFYSWVMNNHWGTNYRAYQEGPTIFRYLLRPHRKSTPDEATRFAAGFSQPLIVTRAVGNGHSKPLVRIEPAEVIVTAMKPSDDGKAIIVRLFGASGTAHKAALTWSRPAPKTVWLSNTSEKRVQRVDGAIEVPGYGLVTLRAEFSNN